MNPEDWDPESRGMESGIQYLCGFRYMGRLSVVAVVDEVVYLLLNVVTVVGKGVYLLLSVVAVVGEVVYLLLNVVAVVGEVVHLLSNVVTVVGEPCVAVTVTVVGENV